MSRRDTIDEIETKSSISKSMASSRIDPPRRLRDGDGCACVWVAHAGVCAHRHPSRVEQQPSFAYNRKARSCACVRARVRVQQEKPIGPRGAAKSQRDWYGIVRHNQR